MYRVVQLLQFFINVRRGGRVADIRVDFAFAGDANSHRLQIPMIHVRRNNHPPASYFVANQLRLQPFAFRNKLHLFGDHALPREMHLRDVSVPVRLCRFRFPVLNPSIAKCHRAPSEHLTGAS